MAFAECSVKSKKKKRTEIIAVITDSVGYKEVCMRIKKGQRRVRCHKRSYKACECEITRGS